MRTFEAFLEVVLRFSDLERLEFRDDQIAGCIKALRRLREGASSAELRAEGRLVGGVEEVLGILEEFVRKADAEESLRLEEALRIFIRSPAPCKKITLSVVATLLGRSEAR